MFQQDRIVAAVLSAAEKTDETLKQYAQKLADAVEQRLIETQSEFPNGIHIQDIQTMVENYLMQGEYQSLARHYIEYRHDRDIAREKPVH